MTQPYKHKIAIVGATGYTGAEVFRICNNHPLVDVVAVASRSTIGMAVSEVFPALRSDLSFCAYEDIDFAGVDLAFVCLPHATAAASVEQIHAAGCKCVDLSADLRYQDPQLYKSVYEVEPSLLVGSVPYGLVEWNREKIIDAEIVSNPGCYVTAVLLALLPLYKAKIEISGPVIIDAKSGASGAGRSAKSGLLLSELANDFYGYGTAGHRHQTEMEHQIGLISGINPGAIIFSPHMLPIPRGIQASIYIQTPDGGGVLQALQNAYIDEVFVNVDQGVSTLGVKSVSGTNYTRIRCIQRPAEGCVVIQVVLDNLVKGAAGQAVQNANLMLGIEETSGLLSLGAVA